MITLRSCFLIACTVWLSAGCSGHVSRPQHAIERNWLLSGEALLGSDAAAPELPDDPVLAMSDEMTQFVASVTNGKYGKRAKLRALLQAIINPAQLGIVYDATATLTASETFRQRQANCLSFTTMVVAMVRHIGLDIQFNEVDIPAIWGQHDDSTLVLYKHVNAIVKIDLGPQQVVDLAMEEYDVSYHQRVIPDRLAIAQYYNNRAVELLYDSRHRDSLAYFRKALSLEPEVSYLWTNLGTLYRRAGILDAADVAYGVALDIDSKDPTALSNAARLYRQQGKLDAAVAFETKAERFRMRNPYYRYRQGLNAFLDGDYAPAKGHVQAALRLHDTEHRFYFLLGAIYRKTGDLRRAEQSLRKAIELAAGPRQRSIYERKMAILLSVN